MFKSSIALLILAVVSGPALAQAEAEKLGLKLQVLYDNVPCDAKVETDWGFACLVTGKEKTILFDTGGKGPVLLANQEAMKVDPDSIEVVVISHCHGDHTGGLLALLEKRGSVPVYLPSSASGKFLKQVNAASGQCNVVKAPVTICPGVTVLGPMGTQIIEQALVVDTKKGLVIITGCSHPGIVEMVRHAKKKLKRDVYLVCGGMHLLRHSNAQVEEVIEQLKALGVKKVGATHCTGDKAIEMIRQAFGEDYVPLGAGRVLTL